MSCVHSTPAQGRSRGRAPLFLIQEYLRLPGFPSDVYGIMTQRSDSARPRPYTELDQALHTLGGYVLLVAARVHNQECATACTTSMLCCDGRTSHHVTWFKRLCWQTVQSDHKRVVPKAGLRTTQYLSCTRVHGFIT